MIKIIKKETQTNINLEKIEQLYLENKTKVSNLLRFDGQDPEKTIDENNLEERINVISWHLNSEMFKHFEIVDTSNEENVLGYISVVLSPLKLHTGLNLSPYSWEELTPAIHSFMSEKEITKWQGWTTYTPVEKDSIINSFNRPDLFTYVGSTNVDVGIDDCIFELNKV